MTLKQTVAISLSVALSDIMRLLGKINAMVWSLPKSFLQHSVSTTLNNTTSKKWKALHVTLFNLSDSRHMKTQGFVMGEKKKSIKSKPNIYWFTVGCSSAGRAPNRQATNAGSIPWCSKGFFSQSQLFSADSLYGVRTLPVCDRIHLHLFAR